MSITISEECSSLAFYGIENSVESRNGFFEHIVNSFERFVTENNVVTTKRRLASKRLKKIPWQKLPAPREISKIGSDKNIVGMTLSSMVPDGSHPMFDDILYASWNSNAPDSEAYLTVPSSIRLLIDWKDFAQNLVQSLVPAYGFGNRRDHSRGASCFPVGLCIGLGFGAKDFAEGDRISGWVMGSDDKVYLHGMIRDVFELNYLNRSQLNHPVGKITLKEWIEKKDKRGTLFPINDQITLWEVDMKHQRSIFKSLLEADVIYDRGRHAYWFDRGKKLTPAEQVALRDKEKNWNFDEWVKEIGHEKVYTAKKKKPK